jgi:hypothetical protein
MVTWNLGEGRKAAMTVALDPRAGVPPAGRLSYQFGDAAGPFEYWVLLVTTAAGRRWWFAYPLGTGGASCERRAAHLCLRDRYIGCRQCHRLTDTSTQSSDRRVAAFARVPG